MTFDAQEIYPNAPIRLVAFEIRHPFSLRASQDDAIEAFQKSLGSFPILEVEDTAELDMGPIKARTQRVYRLLTRDRRTSLTVRPTSVALETSHYDGYQKFRERIAEVLARLGEDFQIAGVERLGLRYWDEIRLDGESQDFSAFAPYISEHLLRAMEVSHSEPFAEFEARPVDYRSVLNMELAEQHRIRLTFGASESGQVVHGNGPLTVRSVNVDQPYFLLDIDSFWRPTAFEDYDEAKILHLCDDLHQPIRSLFETSITDALRDDVLRKAP